MKTNLILFLIFSCVLYSSMIWFEDDPIQYCSVTLIVILGIFLIGYTVYKCLLQELQQKPKIYIENNGTRNRFYKTKHHQRVNQQNMEYLRESRISLNEGYSNYGDPKQSNLKSSKISCDTYQSLKYKSLNAPNFISYSPYQSFNIDDIKWADQQLLLHSLKYSQLKIIIPKLKKVIQAIYHKYDEGQTSCFLQLKNAARTHMKFDNNCGYKQRNSLYSEIVEIKNEYRRSGKLIKSPYIKEYPQNNKQFQQQLNVVLKIMSNLEYKRFLQVDNKLDLLELIIDYLKNNVLFLNPPSLVFSKRELPFSNLQQNQAQLIYYSPEENFCFVSKHQTNHVYNLEETVLLSIIRSHDYKRNPNILSNLLRLQ